jgi:hypothetical protein
VRRHTTIDLYGVDVWLVTTVRDFERLCSDLSDVPQPHPWECVPEFHVVIALDVASFTEEPHAALRITAHEATHAAGFIFEYIGEEWKPDSETFAYLVGWLTEWCWGHLPAKVRGAA